MPLGEKSARGRATSWSVTCHMVVNGVADGAEQAPTDAVACLICDAEVAAVCERLTRRP